MYASVSKNSGHGLDSLSSISGRNMESELAVECTRTSRSINGKGIDLKTLKGRDYLGDLGIYVRIIFKRISLV